MNLKEESLKLHEENHGKLEVKSKVKIENQHDLSLAYTPGVAFVCKEIEKNPKWIVDKVKGVYYGFHDIDFILAESNIFSSLPRFKISKTDRYELWLPSDISIKDVDEIVRLALVGKIQVKYGLIFRDKSLNWLSILCYMLDGGDIREDKVAFENTKN